MLSIDEINLLQSQNDALKKQNGDCKRKIVTYQIR